MGKWIASMIRGKETTMDREILISRPTLHTYTVSRLISHPIQSPAYIHTPAFRPTAAPTMSSSTALTNNDESGAIVALFGDLTSLSNYVYRHDTTALVSVFEVWTRP